MKTFTFLLLRSHKHQTKKTLFFFLALFKIIWGMVSLFIFFFCSVFFFLLNLFFFWHYIYSFFSFVLGLIVLKERNEFTHQGERVISLKKYNKCGSEKKLKKFPHFFILFPFFIFFYNHFSPSQIFLEVICLWKILYVRYVGKKKCGCGLWLLCCGLNRADMKAHL